MNSSIVDIDKYIKSGDINELMELAQEHNLDFVDGKLIAKDISQTNYLAEHYGHLQQAGKIRLNSLYGCLLNDKCRFFDERLGKSVTLTGRMIVRHMNAFVNQIITGEYDYKGTAITAVDTDSCYFSAYDVLKENPTYSDFEWSRDNIISLYDSIAETTNNSFPDFMNKSFNCSIVKGALIKAGRELIASKALFIKKKKYAALMYEKEGERFDLDGKPGKLKITGLDIKRADSPVYLQKFLEKFLLDLLSDISYASLNENIRAFREEFKTRPGWEKGTPKAVKSLTKFRDEFDRANSIRATDSLKKGQKGNRVNMPGHVRASLNWNHLCETFGDRYSMRISDGAKVIVCKLRSNVLKMDSVAYPIDQIHLPAWFKELPFDHDAMEETIIDAKINNLVGVLKWDLSLTKTSSSEDFFVFS